jgi:deazaflavin-dependent oxidoreductase (nitroreductase family)
MSDFNQQIIEEFRANGGKVGGRFEGAPMVLLATTGARSGNTYTTPLVAFPDGDDLYIVASKGGAPTHPAWYHNLKANPDVSIEIGTETRDVTAVELTPEERAPIWQKIVTLMPGFGEYEKTAEGRLIPVIRLDPR